MVRGVALLAVLAAALIAVALIRLGTEEAAAQIAPNPTATNTPRGTRTPTKTNTPTATNTPRNTSTHTATATRTPPPPTRPATNTPTRPPESRPTPSPTPTPTPAERATSTPTLPGVATSDPARPGTITTFTATPTPLGLTGPTATATATSASFTGPTRTPTRGTFTGNPTRVDLAVTALEVTQGIQDLQNRIPLVTSRWTAVRLYARVEGADVDVANVRGALGGWRGNDYLGVIYPENDPIVAHPSGGDRVALDDSLYFYLPTSWRSGTLRLKGVVYQTDTSTLQFEPNDENNYIEVTVEFFPVDPMYVRLVPEHVHQNYDGAQPESTFYYFGNEDVVAFVMLDLFRYLPISQLFYDPSMNFPITIPPELFGGGEVVVNGPVFPNNHVQGFEWDFRATPESRRGDWADANAAMSILKLWSAPPVNGWQWYGMVDDAMETGVGGTASYGVSSGKFGTDWTTIPRNLKSGGTVVHEIGHRVLPGDDHINCRGDEIDGGALDVGFPYPDPNCSMAAIDPAGFYGFDVYWSLWPDLLNAPSVVSNHPLAEEANRGFPFMSYSGPAWADPYDYCKGLAGFGVPCDPGIVLRAGGRRYISSDSGAALAHVHGSTPVARRAPLVGQAPGVMALVSGTVDAPKGAARIDALVLTESAPAEGAQASRMHLAEMAASGGTIALVFLDAAGRPLARYPLANLDSPAHTDEGGADATELGFTEWFTTPSGTAAIELRDGDTMLVRHSGSRSRPLVELRTPNGGTAVAPLKVEWTGSDPDGDPLTYTLLYSADDGANWQPIFAGVSVTSLTLNELGPIGGSLRGRFKVIANDGFWSAEDISDDAVIVADRAPVAAILSPARGGQFDEGATVILTGMGYDIEDFGLEGASLRWRSSLEGAIGEGIEVMTRTLRRGTHEIILTVRDRAGNEATARTQVIIGGLSHAAPPPAEREQIARALGGPAGNEEEPLTWWLLIGGLGGALVGLGGAAAWQLRRRGTRLGGR